MPTLTRPRTRCSHCKTGFLYTDVEGLRCLLCARLAEPIDPLGIPTPGTQEPVPGGFGKGRASS